jgi:hypothetical protein
MGENARLHVRQFHDLRRNYRMMEAALQETIAP